MVLCFSTGELFLYQNSEEKSLTDDYGQFKEAGLVSGNILASKWSPNQEYYVVVTDEDFEENSGTLILFTPEFDILYKTSLDDGDLTFHNLVGESNEKLREV